MEMVKNLPILLVSAENKEAAAYIISEIVDNKVQDVEASEINKNQLDCVWRLTNKYYTVDVWVHALLDGEDLAPELVNYVEAHLIYFTEKECSSADAARVMQQRAAAGGDTDVRLAAADVEREPAALGAACARDHYELVPLREVEPPPDVAAGRTGDDYEDFERGTGRARAALHAHVWPGLKHHRHTDGGGDSDEEWAEWQATGGAEAAQEDAFFAALASLPGAAAAAREAAGGRDERLARAERLVAAFCRALGTPFD